MKIKGVIYTDSGNKICDFTSATKYGLGNCRKEILVSQNKIKFTDCSLNELDVEKIVQIYKTLCEMI